MIKSQLTLSSTPILNFYYTEHSKFSNLFEFDCLDYFVTDDIVKYETHYSWAHQFIAYCIRPTHGTWKSLSTENPSMFASNFTFEELKHNGITGAELLSWSATMDLVENYEAYLAGDVLTSDTDVYYNCTPSWFGNRCEYTLSLGDQLSLPDIISLVFSLKSHDYYWPDGIPCYTLIQCNRGPRVRCLDWREICDGKIDCIDGGADEVHCWQLEQWDVVPGQNEFRCHNGMHSISNQYHRDALFNPDCIDRSDESSQSDQWDQCYQDPAFRCEEHTCRMSRDNAILVCGDGQCVRDWNECKNGRGYSRWTNSDLPTLPSNCEDLMFCLTRMRSTVRRMPCTWFCNGRCAFNLPYNCPEKFPFPSEFIALGHVFFLYESANGDRTMDRILPSYVCFKPEKCPLIQSIMMYNGSACFQFDRISLRLQHQLHWLRLVSLIEGYFLTHCFLTSSQSCSNNVTTHRCANSSKCISKHRLLDGVQDCLENDDESFTDSCSLNHTDRHRCIDTEKKCISPFVLHDGQFDCPAGEDEFKSLSRIVTSQTQISFFTLCDGFQELIPILIDGRNHTDETECHQWPCRNLYTACNNIWNCPDGSDEQNCPDINSQLIDRLCINPIKSNDFCSSLYENNLTHCRLRTNVSQLCFNVTSDTYNEFHQWTTDKYLPHSQICHLITGCSANLHPVMPNIIGHQLFVCTIGKLTQIQEVSCTLSREYKSWFYSSLSSTVAVNKVVPSIRSTREKRQLDEYLSPWYCHRGLGIWFLDTVRQRKCLCPPSYYGDRCQYQNQRVSLTLYIDSQNNYRSIYSVVVMLVGEDGMIESFDQIFYIPMHHCDMRKFNQYLIYRSRPKDPHKNFSVQLHAYNKHTLNYHGSWLFLLSFPFLPVHRLTVAIQIPSEQPPRCSFWCGNHGQCFRFLNRKDPDAFYCRCDPGWTGTQCLV
ncbi:unnamed protein product, partial [Rotaria sp. Silwood2]